jgi:hypothetical protein
VIVLDLSHYNFVCLLKFQNYITFPLLQWMAFQKQIGPFSSHISIQSIKSYRKMILCLFLVTKSCVPSVILSSCWSIVLSGQIDVHFLYPMSINHWLWGICVNVLKWIFNRTCRKNMGRERIILFCNEIISYNNCAYNKVFSQIFILIKWIVNRQRDCSRPFSL